MDRSKIKEATQLNGELENLEWQIKLCKENEDISHYWNLFRYLSPVGKATVQSAILCEAETDRIELAGKIDEL